MLTYHSQFIPNIPARLVVLMKILIILHLDGSVVHQQEIYVFYSNDLSLVINCSCSQNLITCDEMFRLS